MGKKLPRVGFTIILNGLHHLKHNNYANYLANILDYWIIVEGATWNYLSTSWVKGSHHMDKFMYKGHSIDGTVQYLLNLQDNFKNVSVIFNQRYSLQELKNYNFISPYFSGWLSKDIMVNSAIQYLKNLDIDECFLWQIDIDEQWSSEQMDLAEQELLEQEGRVGQFYANHIVGKNLVAIGPNWGGNLFDRLWIWRGEDFLSHEPPILNIKEEFKKVILSPIFNHYSYYFSQDVLFKSLWYYDDINIYHNWQKLQNEKQFPQDLSYFLDLKKYEGTSIQKKDIQVNFNPKYYSYNLLIPLFNHPLKVRINEFERCLSLNLLNKYIKKIYIFFENFNSEDLKFHHYLFQDKKITVINLNRRQKYSDLINFANHYLKDEICIIANADIWFDKSLEFVDNFLTSPDKILCLTRYDSCNNYQLHTYDGYSQDSWIFISPIKNADFDIYFGILGCDSYFHTKLINLGYELLNPCLQIKTYHEHNDSSHFSKTRNNVLENGLTYGKYSDWQNILVKPLIS